MNRNRRFLHLFGFLLGIGFLSWQIIRNVNQTQDNPVFPLIVKPGYLLVSTICIGISIIIQIAVWWKINKALGILFPFYPSLLRYLTSFIPRYIPGTVWGYFSRSDSMQIHYGIDRKVSNFVSLVEIFFAASAGLLGGIVFLLFDSTPNTILPVLSLIFGLYLILRHLLNRLIPKFFITPAGKLIVQPMSLGDWFSILFTLALNWIPYGLALQFTIMAVNDQYSLTLTTVLHLTLFFSLAWLIGFIAFIIPSGIGIREFILAGLLTGTGIRPEVSLTVVVIFRIVMLITELLLVMTSLLLTRGNWDFFRSHGERG